MRRIIDEIMIYEGLEISYAMSACLMNLNRMWNIDNTFRYEEYEKTIKMVILRPPNLDDFNGIIKHIENFLGYFPAHIVTKTSNFKYTYEKAEEVIKKQELAAVYFDAKYDVEISEDKLPPILYHISPSIHEEKILKIGLAPKSKNKLSKHPERIYLTFTPSAAIGLLGNRPFKETASKFTLFLVDFEKLKTTRVIRVFEDPMYYGKGCYTYENIPPKYLAIAKRIKN